MRVSEKEYENVVKLSPQDRYGIFIRRVADWELVWTLANEEGYAFMRNENDGKFLPVWPGEFYAQKAVPLFGTYSPLQIDLYEFLDTIVPDLEYRQIGLLVFPAVEADGLVVEHTTVIHDIKEECEQYE
jgi:hypothetical protein